ncbi:MAG: M20 family metallo-hydrolase, partial [Thermoplasmata archaeon]|nr:M20 family metallo-hydrolase [Thermoplasmata archaeon]
MNEIPEKMTDNALTDKIFSTVEGMRDEIVENFMGMLRIPALSPANGGEGEGKKAEYLMRLLKEIGVDEIKLYDAPDTVPRPNIIAIKHGKDRTRRLWVMTHTDVVPPGEASLWETDPFEPVVKNGKVYARGAEDNGQELMASLYGLKALNKLRIIPAMDIVLAFVADEETGSEKGIKFLLGKGIFKKDDLIIVPDAGNPDGTELEVAEKSILWLKIITKGKQCHASTPGRGINAFAAGMRFGVLTLEEIKKEFDAENRIFKPPASTFEPTKKEANVPNVNTIPGEDVFYLDCRILPEYDMEEVMKSVRGVAD